MPLTYPVCGAGVDSFDVNLEKQEVVVKTDLSYDDVLQTIKKTGKEVGRFFDVVVLSESSWVGTFRFALVLLSSKSGRCFDVSVQLRARAIVVIPVESLYLQWIELD